VPSAKLSAVDAWQWLRATLSDPEELLVGEQQRAHVVARVAAAMGGLRERDRLLLRAVYWEGRGLAEAARSVGLEYDPARYRVTVALGELERQLRRASIARARHR
jgi:DNA-directed RNA polymerase specialized sigma24 family protein